MKLRFRRFLWELCKLAGIGALFLFLQNQVIQIRYDLHGNTNGIAEAQTGSCQHTRQIFEDLLGLGRDIAFGQCAGGWIDPGLAGEKHVIA